MIIESKRFQSHLELLRRELELVLQRLELELLRRQRTRLLETRERLLLVVERLPLVRHVREVQLHDKTTRALEELIPYIPRHVG